MKKHLLFCIGTRPEAIKLAPLILLARARGYPVRILSTGQHREMLSPLFEFFGVKPDVDLEVLKPNQTLLELTSEILQKISSELSKPRPDFVFVQGDTTTAFAAGLAAFYEKIPVVHIEAGLRTLNRYSPFPEEMNRKLIAALANFHFAPTEAAKKNLLAEGYADQVWVTGNTGIDALRISANFAHSPSSRKINPQERMILVTCHRRENHGPPLIEICKALLTIAEKFPDVRVVFPVHLNPNVQKIVRAELGNHDRITLLSPLNYPEFSKLMSESFLILTDSGGVQEEAPYFKKPILVLRDSTERPEGIEAKVAELIGSNQKTIVERVARVLEDQAYYESFQHGSNPYGDGFASEKILDQLGLL